LHPLSERAFGAHLPWQAVPGVQVSRRAQGDIFATSHIPLRMLNRNH